MILDKLIIKNTLTNEIIRNVTFNSHGLSLISDGVNEKSGSNIGKSTFVKIIDLCLGSSDSPTVLYKEKDTGVNETVKNFLNKYKVQAILYFTIKNIQYSVTRDLFSYGKIYINDEECSKEEFEKKLNILIFNNEHNIPTINQLMSKFIRLNSYNEEALLKYIGPFPKNFEYNAIYKYLFKVSSIEALNIELKNNNIKIQREIDVLLSKNKVVTIALLKRRLELVKMELEDYDVIFKNFSTLDEYKIKEKELKELKSNITLVEKEVDKYQYKIDILNENKQSELNKVSKIDQNKLIHLYKEINEYVKDALKEFNEFEVFHNKMIQKRIDVINNVINKSEEILNDKKNELDKLRKFYEDNYVNFEYNLKSDFEKKYEDYESTKILLGTIQSDLNYIEELNNKIKENILNLKTDKFDNRQFAEDEFNKYFVELTNNILDEKYLITFANNNEDFPIQIIGLNGKLGTGTKKAIITCFDLALIKMIIENNYCMPHFEIHDKMENIPLIELDKIIEETRNFEGQYIFPILSDRISELGIKDDEIILKLSKDDKLFKI